MRARTAFPALLASSLLLSAATAAGAATAQESADAVREAGVHFQRGVALYGEGDYRSALVEFKRAYSVAPNVAVLYNVGETQYQLQDYAAALTTFTSYLGESSPNEAHRAEVQNTIEVLRGRVGHVSIATDPPGADVAIDDVSVGKTPLESRVIVSIGRRKVTASMAGRSPATRFIDVAGADNLTVKLSLPAAASDVPPELSTLPPPVPMPAKSGSTLRIVGWSATGVLAAGAGVSGVLAIEESKQLAESRNSYPTSSETLKHEAGLTGTYSILADSLAAAAVVVGGITLFSTVAAAVRSHSAEGGARAAESPASARVWIGPAAAHFEMTF